MAQTLEDMLQDTQKPLARANVYARAYTDLGVSLAVQYSLTIGGAIMNTTPTYIKKASVASIVLVLPFFVVVFSGLTQNKSFLSLPGATAYLMILLMLLPATAFIISAANYARWLSDPTLQKKRSLRARITDLKHTWPILAVGCLSLAIVAFVPFHDSVHCVTGNPIRTIHNPSQTWHCVQNGLMGGK